MRFLSTLASLITIALLIHGCASPFHQSDVPDLSKLPSEAGSDLLFPYGSYKHWVKLEIRNEGSSKSFDFLGIVQTRQDRIEVRGVTLFGMTALLVVEDLVKKTTSIEIYFPPLKRLEPRILQYYQALRLILLCPQFPTSNESLKVLSFHTTGNGKGLPEHLEKEKVNLNIPDYDAQKVPTHLTFEHPQFHVEVKVEKQ
jgi:hypothetical protein